MSKDYKCPICGETEHYLVEIIGEGNSKPALSETVILDGHIYPHCDAYVCKKCGHVDFFAKDVADKLSAIQREREEKIKRAEEALSKAQVQRQTALAPLLEEEDGLNRRLLEIAPLLSSEDITIKQHRELQAESNKIQRRIEQIAKQKAPFDRKIRDAEDELERAKLS